MIDTTQLVRELTYQIRLGEDSAYEFKSVIVKGKKIEAPGRDDTADGLAAFANASGGILVLGINDKTRDVDGIEPEMLEIVSNWLKNLAHDLIDPPLPIETRRVEIPNNQGELRPVIWVRVNKSVFVHRSPHGYYLRVADSKREMPPDLLARLFQQRSMTRLIRFDEQIVPEARPEAATPELKSRFLRDTPERAQLRKLYLLGEDENGEERLTVSGVLLLTPHPTEFLSYAYIQCVAYSGEERNAEYQLDAQDCNGPLDAQIAQTLTFVKRNMRVEVVKRPGRIDIPQYDLAAVFEAIVNAVAHRDYAQYGARIRLHLFASRLELSTPGGLPNSLSISSMEANSISRNETLVNLLSRYYPADPVSKRQNLIERRGEGVPTIFSASERLSTRRPLYELIEQTELKLTIYAASRDKNGLLERFDAEDEA